MHVTLASTAVICTAYRRPDYFRQVLASWQAARGIGDIRSFTLALGWHEEKAFADHLAEFGAFRQATGLGTERGRLRIDHSAARRANGMHHALGEAGNHVFADPAVEFTVFGEEDIIVSSDALELMAWGKETFADDPRVLCVCAHNPGAQGWDRREPMDDAGADQSAVRLHATFNSWGWGIWRDRWERVMSLGWDWSCNLGGPTTSGYDWRLLSIVRANGYLCALPDASRSQNIGQHGGWAANPADFPLTQAQSFRADRPGPVAYRLVEAEERAA